MVHDYGIDILARFAKIGESETNIVYPYLEKSLICHNSRHAGHAIDGFINVISKTDLFDGKTLELIEPYLKAEKKIVAGKANKLKKLILKRMKK